MPAGIRPASLLSVVVPLFNRCDSVLALLADLDRQTGVDFEVIVVDDHSPIDPTPRLLARFPSTRVLRNERNRGPAVSRNRGIRAARGEIIVGFDSDVTVPDPTTLRRIAARFAAEPAVDGLAFRLLEPDGRTEDAARWWHPVPCRDYADRRFLTSYFSGTGYAFRRAVVVAAGLFPESLYMHYEEVELAFRVLDRGGNILYAPEFAVLHHAHPASRRSEVRVFYKPRNQILLAVGCLPLARAVAFVAPRLAYQFLLALREGHLRAFGRALRSAVRLLPDRCRERQVLRPATLRRLAALRRGMPASPPPRPPSSYSPPPRPSPPP